ncbi:DUF1828 domain-containing protein [Pseudomonas sp. R2.Fl]|nr:DUF1828 domain-containing protein [Pseudomonas sp. R2.Fl]MCL6714383.1 DUF1828 domain-containing protein [Pseudomonas sp. R2.Fl]
MNHDAIAHALCGKYTRISDRVGYIESPMAFPSDGTLIGAYVTTAGDGKIRITDDGDVAFHMAVAGAEITSARMAAYREIAAHYGLAIDDDGILNTVCPEESATAVLARYVQAVSAIATKGLRHRPKEDERFERLVTEILVRRYGARVSRRPEVVGLSGHIVRFPLAIDYTSERPSYIQTIAADNNVIQWKSVYEAGGKFKDVRGARADVPLIAVMEASRDSDKAANFLADSASVLVYTGGDIDLDFARAA